MVAVEGCAQLNGGILQLNLTSSPSDGQVVPVRLSYSIDCLTFLQVIDAKCLQGNFSAVMILQASSQSEKGCGRQVTGSSVESTTKVSVVLSVTNPKCSKSNTKIIIIACVIAGVVLLGGTIG